MSALSYSEIMYQACQTAEDYMRRALDAVAKAQAEGYEISDVNAGVLMMAFMSAAASDYAVHARIKFEEENLGQ
jgi:hypothetical protein